MFSKTNFVTGEFEGPAATDINTREMYWDISWYNRLTPDQRKMVEYHEEGHLVLNTEDEELADAYAFEKYAGEGRSLKESIDSIAEILPCDNPEQSQRLKNRMNDALQYDWAVYGNEKAGEYLRNHNMDYTAQTEKCGCSGKASDMKYFFGMGSVADIVHSIGLPTISDIQENRQKKQQAKIDLKKQEQEDEAYRKLMLASQGIDAGGSKWTNAFGQFGAGLGGFYNKMAPMAVNGLTGMMNPGGGMFASGNPEDPYFNPYSTLAPVDTKEDNTGIIVAVVAVIAVVAAILIFKNKKTS